MRVVRRMLITTDHLDLLSLVIVVSFCCSDVSRFMSAMMGGRPDDVAAPRQTLSYLTFAGLVNLLARLFRVNQPYQSAPIELLNTFKSIGSKIAHWLGRCLKPALSLAV